MPWIGGCAAAHVARALRTSRFSSSYGTAIQRQSLRRLHSFDASAARAGPAPHPGGQGECGAGGRSRANSLEQDADDRALCGQHLEDSPLVVEPQQVIPGQAESADRWLSADGAMWSMPVVAMGEEGQLLGALL